MADEIAQLLPGDATGTISASYDRELCHAGRKRQTLLTYRKAWKQFEAAFARLPTDRTLILDYLGNFDGPSGRSVSTTRTPSITCTSTLSHWAGWCLIPCTG